MKRNCASSWAFTQNRTRMHGQQNIQGRIYVSYLLQTQFFNTRNILVFVSNAKVQSFSINPPALDVVCSSHLRNACCMNHPFRCSWFN